MKSSLQRDLDRFYKAVMGGDFSIREVTKSAFTQARSKINPQAFVELSDKVLESFYSEAPYLTFDGMRLLAADGTKLSLPHHSSVIEEFGETGYGPYAAANRSHAQASFLYDTLNLTVLDAQLAPMAIGERELLGRHLAKVAPGDMLLLDRGYPSIGLFFELTARKINFCVRMRDDWWHLVREFAQSGQAERIVSMSLQQKDQWLLEEFPGLGQQIQVRLVCVALPNGEKEYLATSLLDTKRHHQGIFLDLYHHRWGVEEAFKLFKARVEIQEFSGRTARAVRQDFHAKVFAMNLCAVLAFPVEERLRKETDAAAHQQKGGNSPEWKRKVNRTSAIALMGELMVGALLKQNVKKTLQAFTHTITATFEILKVNRKSPRKHLKKRQPRMAYKRL